MAIFVEQGEGKYLVEGEKRELRFTVIHLPEDYKAPEGIPEGTKRVLVYDFTDDEGGRMVSYESSAEEGIPIPESLEGELRNTLDKIKGVPEEERRPIELRAGDKGLKRYTKDERKSVYEGLGLNIANNVVILKGKAVVNGRPADWTHYEIGEKYCENMKDAATREFKKGVTLEQAMNDREGCKCDVTLDSLEYIGDFRFTDEEGGQAIAFKKKYVSSEPLVIDDILRVLYQESSTKLDGPDITHVGSNNIREMYHMSDKENLIIEKHEKGKEKDIAKLLRI